MCEFVCVCVCVCVHVVSMATSRMAANSKLSRRAGEDEQYTFCWKLFTSWDYMIGLSETAKNKLAEIITIFKARDQSSWQ